MGRPEGLPVIRVTSLRPAGQPDVAQQLKSASIDICVSGTCASCGTLNCD